MPVREKFQMKNISTSSKIEYSKELEVNEEKMGNLKLQYFIMLIMTSKKMHRKMIISFYLFSGEKG